MNEEPSIVRKTVFAIDDLFKLWRKRKIVCVIVVVVIVVIGLAACIRLYQGLLIVPGLKADLNQKQEEIQDLQGSVRRVEQERDKAQVQLAPFLATAKLRFPGASPDKRLELLLEKLEHAVSDVQDAARRIGEDRVLSDDLVKNAVAKLKQHPSLTVDIACVMGDTETFVLAKQLKDLFAQAGWPITEGSVTQALFLNPQPGCRFVFSEQIPTTLEEPFLKILDALGQDKGLFLNQEQQKGTLKITVGSK